MATKIVTAPKVNMAALIDAVCRFNKNYRVTWTGTNGILIITDEYRIDVEDIIGLSFRLYGTHNRLKTQVEDGKIALDGASYYLQPEFLVEGEQVEFEVTDYRHEE